VPYPLAFAIASSSSISASRYRGSCTRCLGFGSKSPNRGRLGAVHVTTILDPDHSPGRGRGIPGRRCLSRSRKLLHRMHERGACEDCRDASALVALGKRRTIRVVCHKPAKQPSKLDVSAKTHRLTGTCTDTRCRLHGSLTVGCGGSPQPLTRQRHASPRNSARPGTLVRDLGCALFGGRGRKGALENRYGPQVALLGACQHRGTSPIDSATLLL
jgi:hypothetical protein